VYRIDSLHDLVVEELRDLYDIEKQLAKALPRLVEASSSGDLRRGLSSHLEETREQLVRLDQVFDLLDETAGGTYCSGIRGLIEEGEAHIDDGYGYDAIRDAVIVAIAQRMEHYEIAAYGTAIAHADWLGLGEVSVLLGRTLREEKAADRRLTQIALSEVNPRAGEERDEAGGRTDKRRSPAPGAQQAHPSGLVRATGVWEWTQGRREKGTGQ
jgi:ferritin-like metal-binding protein YciE